MLTNDDTKHYAPIGDVVALVASRIPADAKVLEIGPGLQLFPKATHVIDAEPREYLKDHIKPENIIAWDVHKAPLPFPDKYFDFIYCRHVIEDVHYPIIVFDEMSRVGKAGFIETPSPLAEACRGIDGNSPPWRGYHHHNWFVWTHEDVLHLFKKFSRGEYMTCPNEPTMESLLKSTPWLWNTYYHWEGRIKYKEIPHGIYYSPESQSIIAEAISQGVEGSKAALLALMAASS